MKKQLLCALAFAIGLTNVTSVTAQERYLDEIFTDAEIVKAQSNELYGINVDYMGNQSLLSDAYVNANIVQIQTEHDEIRDSLLAGIQGGYTPDIPIKYYTPYSLDPSTEIKLINPLPDNPPANLNPFQQGMMDMYMPNPSIDPETERPVIVFIHTGNFLPKGVNVAVSGNKDDSVSVELCKQWARRGYIAVAANYRLGWNPNPGVPQSEKTKSLLNAVYRAITDIKQVVRGVRVNAASINADADNIMLYGQGSGGYVALAYNFLDRWEETNLPKFDPDATGNVVIDTNLVGQPSGFGGVLNFYQYQMLPQVPATVSLVANAGGALGDKSWIEGKAEEAPVVTFHSFRDEFAPFETGTVIVPTTQEPVVDADGPNVFMPIVNSFGLNDAFATLPGVDAYTGRARSLYGATFTSDLPAGFFPGGSVTVSNDAEGLFTIESPLGYSAPWEWWSEADFTAYYNYLDQLGIALQPLNSILTSAADGNVNQKASSLMYLDSIQGYLNPRIMRAAQIGNWEALSTEELGENTPSLKFYPNPTSGIINFTGATVNNLEVINLNGQVVKMAQPNVATGYVDVSDLPSGLYIVKSTTESGTETSRIIIE